MISDNQLSQCIYCESVYNVKDSKAKIPNSCCCEQCYENYLKFLEDLEFN